MKTKYSLWLVPRRDSETFTFLRGKIDDMASLHGTCPFDPHVALLEDIKDTKETVLAKTKALAEIIAPSEVRFEGLGTKGIYFQILFAKIKRTPRLMAAYEIAKKIFAAGDELYSPYCSLIYGNLHPDQLGAAIRTMSEILTNKRITFLAEEIEMWNTSGYEGDWKKVASVAFNGHTL